MPALLRLGPLEPPDNLEVGRGLFPAECLPLPYWSLLVEAAAVVIGVVVAEPEASCTQRAPASLGTSALPSAAAELGERNACGMRLMAKTAHLDPPLHEVAVVVLEAVMTTDSSP